MNTTTRIHAIFSESDQLAIVNALAFYNDYWAAKVEHDSDSMEQWRISFREDNRGIDNDGPVDQLATKIANLS